MTKKYKCRYTHCVYTDSTAETELIAEERIIFEGNRVGKAKEAIREHFKEHSVAIRPESKDLIEGGYENHDKDNYIVEDYIHKETGRRVVREWILE